MISLQLIRDDPGAVKRAIARKGEPPDAVDRLVSADARRRALEAEANDLRAERNAGNRELGELMRTGRRDEADALKARLAPLSQQIDALTAELGELEAAIEADLLLIPNLPHDTVPDGASADDNPVIRSWGEPAAAGSSPPHWEIGERLRLFDLERGAKVAGSGFILYTGAGARLQRALIGLMLELTERHGYREVWSPILVNAASARGTGQLPDKEGQMYVVERDDLYLIPTAEVPVTNLYRDEILAGDDLPIYHAAYTPCFRREAGAAGKDTRGLLRVHQFDKVEMVKFVHPESSWDELETLTRNAEEVLEALEIPYRTVERCTADLGFAPAKGYDLEAWSPGVGKWLEVSSCSNYTDFQARRMNLRYRASADARPELLQTLNGSGLGMSRT
ncbi:MAG: serine--tRNA ligase, partial [Candidatus Limnocylindria bacterium]